MFVFHARNSFCCKMNKTPAFDVIRENAKRCREVLKAVENEFAALHTQYIQIRSKQLLDENKQLNEAVENAKQKLTALDGSDAPKLDSVSVPLTRVAVNKKVKTPAEKQVVKEIKKPEQDSPVDVGRLDFRVAKIVEVKKHPDADSLYVLSVNCGEDKCRTVCSGLVKHIPMHELENRSVVLLCNLKPAKMRGITSEAMVMCASTPDKVEVLLPPEGTQPGDVVSCDGFPNNPDPVLNPKKKIFETVALDLKTNMALEACYKDIPLEVSSVKGRRILAATLKNVPIK